ncbi:MAG: hypothetical protein D6739_09430 [Nitrospirae bacterium]|nr:MAG: hypothetical protein D6739_09430 [Nitrospirota bacterium]
MKGPVCLALAATLALPAATGAATLPELLHRKGLLTAEEAASVAPAPLPKGLRGVKLGVLAYVDYSVGETGAPGGDTSSLNRFTLTRGYLTVKKRLLPWMYARTTADIHQDADEDWKFRLKYLYAELRPADLGPLTGMKAEIGQGHIPWLDFEEHVNPYRAQGTMALERAGIFNSADVGISLRGSFAGELEQAGERTGNHHYAGRYGSWHVGLYNGGGYHAKEKNDNKVLEGRVTIRPLPEALPGLQLSYLGITGKGNTDPGPDYTVNDVMLSYEHPAGILTAQYFQTTGNASGSLVDGNGDALDTEGWSLFGRLVAPGTHRKLAAFARYDHFDADKDGVVADRADYDLYLAGLSFDLHHGNMVLLDYERVNFGADSGGLGGKAPKPGNDLGDNQRVQVVYQIKY